jgi:hypothetical protein
MVFLRNPQTAVHAGRAGASWAVSLEAPNSVIDTGKLSQVDPALGAGGDGAQTGCRTSWVPIARARLGHVKAAAILREVGFQTSTTASGNPSNRRPATAST